MSGRSVASSFKLAMPALRCGRRRAALQKVRYALRGFRSFRRIALARSWPILDDGDSWRAWPFHPAKTAKSIDRSGSKLVRSELTAVWEVGTRGAFRHQYLDRIDGAATPMRLHHSESASFRWRSAFATTRRPGRQGAVHHRVKPEHHLPGRDEGPRAQALRW